MALLQIAEPGQSTNPHEHKLAVGIDLGTTNSLVATVRSGLAMTLTNLQTDRDILPSVVQYKSNGQIVVGEGDFEIQQPIISSVKRLLGYHFSEIQQRYPNLTFPLVQDENQFPNIPTAQGLKSPIEVSAEILRSLRCTAEAALSGELDGAVITVPAYFDDAQRGATKDAAKLAGINVLRLINEPTAAAIAYGLDKKQRGTIAVYDLGGGTFDISILKLTKGVFEVLATGGDPQLGGDDFDQAISLYLQEQSGFKADSFEQKRLLQTVAKQAKEALTTLESTKVQLGEWQGILTRNTLNTLIDDAIQTTLQISQQVLKDAGLKITDISEVVLVGGSTRILRVREKVRIFAGREPLTDIDPDKVVALGAAQQANVLVGNKNAEEMLLLDVNPLSLGVETMGGLMEVIIPRNTTIPIARAQEFTTFKDGQTAMTVHVLQGERDLVTDCRSLAKFTLKGIPPMVAGAAHIRITYQIDADGMLSVTAMEKSTGVSAEIQVKPSYGLSDESIAKMLTDSMLYAEGDMKARMLAEQQVEAKRVIEGLDAALEQDGETLLSAHMLLQLRQEIKILADLLKTSEDSQVIKKQIEHIDTLSQTFASQRMDLAVRNALTGHSVSELDFSN